MSGHWTGRLGAGRLRSPWGSVVLLGALGVALVGTNRWFTAVDDEVTIIDRAAAPVAETLRLFWSGVGQHEHPPLYDLLLHGWLRLTGGSIYWIRVPAIAFYLAGIWLVARIAREIGGEKAGFAALVISALSPYGFHFGRVAAWYSFCFMLVALVTFLHFRYLRDASLRNWVRLFFAALALIYANYFGWALLALLACDFAMVHRKQLARAVWPIVGMGALLFAAFLPIALAFFHELHNGVRAYSGFVKTALNGVYVLYAMFVSESVAPWFWRLGAPAGIAVATALIATAIRTPPEGKRLLGYFLAALAAMAFIGVVETKRTVMIAPWLILPVALALGDAEPRRLRPLLGGALAAIGAIGWFGIFDRQVYAAPHWLEPWSAVAQEAAGVVRDGGIVVGDHQSFFFYLTYLLPPERPRGRFEFDGLLPYSVTRARVYGADQWSDAAEAGRPPVAKRVMLVSGLHFGTPETEAFDVQPWLDRNCRLESDRQMVRDIGVDWKLRFGPAPNQQPWRVEVRMYGCE